MWLKLFRLEYGAFLGLLALDVSGCGLIEEDSPSHSSTGGAGNSAGGAGAGDAGTGGAAASARAAIVDDAGHVLMPADDRPAVPSSQSFKFGSDVVLGSTGWKNSTVPFCDTHQGEGVGSYVWADARGVFANVATTCSAGTMGNSHPSCEPGMAVQFNDGTGWRIIYGQPGDVPGASYVTGFPMGPVVASTPYYSTAITFVGGVNDMLQGPGLPAAQIQTVPWAAGLDSSAFYDSADHAFFVTYTSDTTPSILSEYHAGAWRELGDLPDNCGAAIWSDGTFVATAAPDQRICVGTSVSDLKKLTDAPAGDYSAVWGFSRSDLWFSNGAGQLVHYDGSSWQVVPTEATGALSLWGAEGVLYYSGDGLFGRYDGKKAETLLNHTNVGSVWGRSKNEVFLTASDLSLAGYQCGEYRVAWFDGTQFHLF